MLEQTKSENNSLKQSLIEHEKSILGNCHFTKNLCFGNLNDSSIFFSKTNLCGGP